ncbi:MAG: hypothetical protein ACT4RN_19375 [Pseudonocardia sp.]
MASISTARPPPSIQVERYAQAVREQLGEDVADLMGGGFTDWEAALRFTVRLAADRARRRPR